MRVQGEGARPWSGRSREWWAHRTLVLLLFCGSLLQQPGRTTFDTKFDLAADPATLLGRIAHAWNPTFDLGQMDDQVYGYLFPHGVWFWGLAELGVPAWLSQRIFSGLILVAACEGSRRLALALGMRPGPAVVAGAAYATAPRLLGLSGVLTGEILPTAVLPWVVLPLVLGLAGHLSPRRAALWSGFALLFTGGINAVENWALLPLAVLLLMTGMRSRAGRRLAAWWVVALAMATLWWILPVFVLLRYSPPFLDFIETADATSGPIGWANALRGADHWVAFFTVGNHAWWPGAHALAVEPGLIVATGLVAALSFTGLVRRDMPLRGPLLLSAFFGLVCLTLPHAGPLGSPFSGTMRVLLDGPLAAVRNIHKVDPLVRLPLALGLAHLVEVATVPQPLRGQRLGRPLLRPMALVTWVVLGAVLAWSALPLLQGNLRTPGWDRVPEAWPAVAKTIAEDGNRGSTLLLPGAGFALQSWGWTIDPPLQAYATTPWVARSQVPLVPGAMIRYLDALAGQSETGSGSLVLAQGLARLGIRNVIVRRDLDPGVIEAATPDRVIDSLERSPGITRVGGYGDTGTGLPMLELFRVDDPAPPVEAVPTSRVRRLEGAADDVQSALGLGVLDPDSPTVIGPLPWDSQVAPDLVGDSYRRVDRAYGRIQDATSQVLTAIEPSRTDRATTDYPSAPGVKRVVARYTGGLRGVSASSSQGYVDTLGPVQPGHGPAAIVDGDAATSWRSTPFQPAVGQWVQLQLRGRRPVTRVEVRIDKSPGLVRPTRLVIAAGRARRTVGVARSGLALAQFEDVQARRVQVSVAGVDDPGGQSGVGLAEIEVRGVRVERALVVPDSGADATTTFAFRSPVAARACYPTPFGIGCDDKTNGALGDPAGLNRVFTVHQSGQWEARGTAVAASDESAAALLRIRGDRMWATASTMLGGDLQVSPGFAVDGSPATYWLADPTDVAPTLRVTFPRPRVLRRLVITPAPGRAIAPTSAVLTTSGHRRTVDLTGDGAATFRPLRTDQLDVRLAAPLVGPALVGRPLGVADIEFNGTAGLHQPYRPDHPTGALCGLGPVVSLDGTSHLTSVAGTFNDLLTGGPLTWRVCDGPVRLSPGTHRLRVQPTPQFVPDALALVSLAPRVTNRLRRAVAVRSWGPTDRIVHLAAGPESVLRIAENTNAGWQATLGGRTLTTVAVDGNQQGYVVPGGPGGDVHLRFVADSPYRAFLGFGLLLAVVLVLAAAHDVVRSRRRRGSSTAAAPARDLRRPPWTAVHGRRGWVWAVTTSGALGASAWLLGGPGVGLGLGVTVLVSARLPRTLPWWVGLGGLALMGSVVVNALSDDRTYGHPPVAAELLAATAAGIWAGTVLRDLGRAPDPQKGVGR